MSTFQKIVQNENFITILIVLVIFAILSCIYRAWQQQHDINIMEGFKLHCSDPYLHNHISYNYPYIVYEKWNPHEGYRRRFDHIRY